MRTNNLSKRKRLKSPSEIEYERITIAKTIREVNKMRQDLGLTPMAQIERKCLRCNRNFTALKNSSNYMCIPCRRFKADDSFDI